MEEEDNSITMVDVLKEQEAFEEDAKAVLGASDDKNCTYSQGYVKRQALYACLTCCPESIKNSELRAGVCLACSLACHENHNLIELYTKRNFRCDCGGPKFPSNCSFNPKRSENNTQNEYNQNFSGLYCTCHRPYPDPEDNVEDEMIQCVICEDWFHSRHLNTNLPPSGHYSEMICEDCTDKTDILKNYMCYEVGCNVLLDKTSEQLDVDIEKNAENCNIETNVSENNLETSTLENDKLEENPERMITEDCENPENESKINDRSYGDVSMEDDPKDLKITQLSENAKDSEAVESCENIEENTKHSKSQHLSKDVEENPQDLGSFELSENEEKNNAKNSEAVESCENIEENANHLKSQHLSKDVEENPQDLESLELSENEEKNNAKNSEAVESCENIEENANHLKSQHLSKDVEENPQDLESLELSENEEKNNAKNSEAVESCENIEENAKHSKSQYLSEDVGENPQDLESLELSKNEEKNNPKDSEAVESCENIEENAKHLKSQHLSKEVGENPQDLESLELSENEEKNNAKDLKSMQLCETLEGNTKDSESVHLSENMEENPKNPESIQLSKNIRENIDDLESRVNIEDALLGNQTMSSANQLGKSEVTLKNNNLMPESRTVVESVENDLPEIDSGHLESIDVTLDKLLNSDENISHDNEQDSSISCDLKVSTAIDQNNAIECRTNINVESVVKVDDAGNQSTQDSICDIIVPGTVNSIEESDEHAEVQLDKTASESETVSSDSRPLISQGDSSAELEMNIVNPIFHNNVDIVNSSDLDIENVNSATSIHAENTPEPNMIEQPVSGVKLTEQNIAEVLQNIETGSETLNFNEPMDVDDKEIISNDTNIMNDENMGKYEHVDSTIMASDITTASTEQCKSTISGNLGTEASSTTQEISTVGQNEIKHSNINDDKEDNSNILLEVQVNEDKICDSQEKIEMEKSIENSCDDNSSLILTENQVTDITNNETPESMEVSASGNGVDSNVDNTGNIAEVSQINQNGEECGKEIQQEEPTTNGTDCIENASTVLNTDSDISNHNESSAMKRKQDEYAYGIESPIKKKIKQERIYIMECIKPVRNNSSNRKGATFWPSDWRSKLCSCKSCVDIYNEQNVSFILDIEDTVSAYEDLGKIKTESSSSQYEKGMEALSSLGHIQQINAITEYNKMKEKLLEFLKTFKDKKEVVKEEDIKGFFADMKPKREPDGVYFCR